MRHAIDGSRYRIGLLAPAPSKPARFNATLFVALVMFAAAAPLLMADHPTTAPALPFDFGTDQSIKIDLTRGNDTLFVKGAIDGREVGYFILDTASSGASIDAATARKLGLRTVGDRALSTQAGDKVLPLGRIDRLTVGPVTFRDLPASLWSDLPYPGIVGVLGTDAFGQCPFTVDFRAATLTLHDPAHFTPPVDAKRFDNQPGADTPVIRASVEGNQGWFALDTAHDSALLLFSNFVGANGDLWRGHPLIFAGKPWGADSDTCNSTWARLEFLGRSISPIHGTMRFRGGPQKSAGLIGVNLFRDARLTVDLRNQAVWISWLEPEPLVQLLARLGDPGSHDLLGMTPLLRALTLERADAVKALLQKHADPNGEDPRKIAPLAIASGRGDIASVAALLAAGAKPRARQKEDPLAPLAVASQLGRREVVQLLLDAGAQIDEPGEAGRGPLFLAAEGGHAETVNLLLERGAKVDPRLETGETPLAAACFDLHADCARLLLEHGANPNTGGARGTPLTLAAERGSADCVSLLLAHGAKVNEPDDMGRTPLVSAAACYGGNECVRLLLEAGADPKRRAGNGQTAFDAAVKRGSAVTVRLLFPPAATQPAPAKAEQP